MRTALLGAVLAAAAAGSMGRIVTKTDGNGDPHDIELPPEPMTPREPPSDVAQHFSDQELKAARKQRWLEGHEVPEEDRRALEEAAARRARRAAKRK